MTDPASGSLGLSYGMLQAFSQSAYVLATFGEYTIALNNNSGIYFILDSHACNAQCLSVPDGSAVLLEFLAFESLEEYLTTVYNWSSGSYA